MLNRQQIFTAIDQQIEFSAGEGGHFAVVMLRTLGLREICLRFGYEHGEQAAEKALKLIEQSLRPDDRIFRAGDDSFAIVLPNMLNHNHAFQACARLSQSFEQPMRNAAPLWKLRVAMGVALCPEHGTTPDLLCCHAEMALDDAQRRGEFGALFRPEHAKMEIFYEDLREAIEANRLQVFFQPVHDLQKRRVVGVESLARWTSARHGEVSPASFVPFSEQSGLISVLTRWSIDATLRHVASLGHGHGLSIAINFSPQVLSRPGMVEQFVGALETWNVAPTSVIVEITETALVNDLESSAQALGRLRDLGVRVAIDDFGTGYASIAYLRRFPATELKIDQSLIGAMRDDRRTCKLVGAIINLAHHMDLSTIAEGIEDQATQDLLVGMGCDFGQGYHMGRPEPAAEFVARFVSMASAP
ncbi:putative bifunctional diguanylate cyclase/phosphodiesterase [Rhodanobacter sp. Col0626]|uniref:putative bifunctional diguanylate cyclase/phosphodiesterase n=1 Tax=Rhodanobacter sp. Col0626 TaxID=3415679 RepID=UPI003CF0A102